MAEAPHNPSEEEPEAGFDQILDRLKQVVGKLEQGSLSLEQSLRAFEEGVRLSRRGAEILDAAERRVEILVRGEPGEPGEDRRKAYVAGESDGRT